MTESRLVISPSVQCRFKLNLGSRESQRRLLNLYGSRFSEVVSKCLSVKLLPSDYRELPGIRERITGKSRDEIINLMVDSRMSSDSIRDILDITPLFEKSPVDFKAFLLLTLGLRLDK